MIFNYWDILSVWGLRKKEKIKQDFYFVIIFRLYCYFFIFFDSF